MKSARLTTLMVAVILAAPSLVQASSPTSGTLSDSMTVLNYTAGPLTQPNASPVPMVDSGPRCNTGAFPCDSYALTINLPTGYVAQHNGPAAKVTLSWVDTGSGASDYDLYVFKGAVATTDGSMSAYASSASGSNPEVASIFPLVDGNSTYTIKIVPYTPSGETLKVKIQLLDGVPGASGGGGASGASNNGCGVASVFGGADPVVPGCPRYQILTPPTGVAEVSSGEFNIGFNPKTGRIMTMNSGPIYRVTPPEIATKGTPEVCDSLWEDKSSTVTDTGLDPILWTDQKTGRTFASNSTVGANAVYAYTDNDGDFWTPIGAGPPNGGADHETIATGPYPATGLGSTFSNPTLNQGIATYYCSQDVVGPASCQRSDSLGSTYGPGVFAYTGTTTECGGLHGHMRVAPDGTSYLPVNQCNGKQGGAVSVDAGTSYSEFIVTGKNPAALGGNTFTATSQANGADPSVAIDSANRAYYCYVNNEANGTEGHAHVAVSEDGGKTWIRDVDVGRAHGIINVAQTEAWGGSPGRAACGFLGSNVAGNYQSAAYKGVWYLFIANTYDGGTTWVTTNATPNDPVQGQGGIWQQGGSGDVNGNRNLLDFNEVTADDRGRLLFGFSDGCVTPTCLADNSKNDFVANLRVARQIGGKSLFASYDPSTDTTTATVPHASCLAGTRDQTGSSLTWKVPDSGGAAISNYQIFRSTASGAETLVGQTADAKPVFKDTTADPTVSLYYYTIKGVNTAGVGLTSNEVQLPLGTAPIVENICALPGLTELTDAAGDDTGAGVPPGVDLLKFSLAQPYAADGTIKLSFTILTNAGQMVLPPNSAWYVAMKVANPTTGAIRYTGVQMVGGSASPVFQTYVPGASNSGAVDGRYVTSGSTKSADPSSSYDAANGKIVIVATLSGLGLSVGDQILGFVSGTTQLVGANGAGSAVLYDSMPDSVAYTTAYTVASNQVCRPNTAPSAALTATPVTGTTPYTVTFTASGTDPDTTAPADTIASYTLDYGDGTTSETQSGSPTTSSATFTHQYTNPGSSRTVYTAKLTVTDSRGKASVNSAFQNIEVLPQATTPTNTAPMASLAASPVSGTSPLTVNFSGAGSSDPDTGDSVASYTFDFGDGSATVTQSSPTTSHVYNAAGSFTAKLMVTDTHAAASSNSATQVITVTTPTATNVAPTASLSASPGTGTVPLVVTFDGSKSSDPDTGDSVSSYTFDFGDGSAAQTQSTATVTHTYTSSGSYTATLVVTDTHGAKSTNTAQQTIVVTAPSTTPNTPPTAALKASPIAGTTPLAVTFDASGSSDADAGDRVTSYTFDFGDGSATLTQTSPTATHTYLSAGSFVASLTVMDMHAAVSPVPATAVIKVGQPQPPTPSEGRLGGGAFGGAELAGLMLLLAAGRRRRAARKGR